MARPTRRRTAARRPRTRVERDTLGEIRVPASALWGAQTARAVENFPISGLREPRALVQAMARIKLAAARVNARLGLLPRRKARSASGDSPSPGTAPPPGRSWPASPDDA